MRILDKLWAQLSMEYLYHAAYHFTDLIEKEWLPSEIKTDELYSFRIISASHLKSITIDIHKLIGLHVHHIALGCHLVRLNLLSKIVIFLRSLETLPAILHLSSLLLTQPSC